MESAEQPTTKLQASVETSLGQLGHRVSTIPPHEGPVLSEEVRGMVEDIGYSAKTALEQAVSGGVTHVRTTKAKKLFSLTQERVKRMAGLQEKVA